MIPNNDFPNYYQDPSDKEIIDIKSSSHQPQNMDDKSCLEYLYADDGKTFIEKYLPRHSIDRIDKTKKNPSIIEIIINLLMGKMQKRHEKEKQNQSIIKKETIR